MPKHAATITKRLVFVTNVLDPDNSLRLAQDTVVTVEPQEGRERYWLQVTGPNGYVVNNVPKEWFWMVAVGYATVGG